ncbi:MAG: flagellar biosynthetic protein FliO [Desulfobacterales bacterium]|nr:MAG: flagellar biosynthetic protein FliO [Desulfobacterales bacterium]
MNAPPDMITTALKMFAALGIVLGALFVVFYFARRVSSVEHSGGKEKLIRVLANKFIGVKKNICAVEVPGALLILGVTHDHITLLTKIEDEEILENIRNHQSTQMPLSFSDHLSKIASKFKSTKGSPS